VLVMCLDLSAELTLPEWRSSRGAGRLIIKEGERGEYYRV